MVAWRQVRWAIMGPRTCSMREPPAPPCSTCTASAGSMPMASPNSSASAAATLCTATSKLAMSFMRMPLPKAPKSNWVWLRPCNTGRTRRSARVSPLPYTVRSLLIACAPVPDSGQSSNTTPASASVSCASCLSGKAKVLVSITTVPRLACCAKVCATSCSACGEGSEVSTTGHACASSAAESGACPPARCSRWRATRRGSCPCTAKPALTKLAAMAEPMMPSPSTPTRVGRRDRVEAADD